MKLQFIPDGDPGTCPLIRLYEFQARDVLPLKVLFESLATGSRVSIALHEEEGFLSVDGCQLLLRVGTQDMEILQKSPLEFEWVQSPGGWAHVAFLTEPFCHRAEANTYQWLNNDLGIQVLLSPDGSW